MSKATALLAFFLVLTSAEAQQKKRIAVMNFDYATVQTYVSSIFGSNQDVGKGIGLGLDIAQRIVVERHGGTITIHSRPGETVLCVRIPIRPPGSQR